MMKILKMVKPLDWVIGAIGAIMLLRINFSNVDLIDVIYMTVFIMWFGMLLMRLWIQWCRSQRGY